MVHQPYEEPYPSGPLGILPADRLLPYSSQSIQGEGSTHLSILCQQSCDPVAVVATALFEDLLVRGKQIDKITIDGDGDSLRVSVSVGGEVGNTHYIVSTRPDGPPGYHHPVHPRTRSFLLSSSMYCPARSDANDMTTDGKGATGQRSRRGAARFFGARFLWGPVPPGRR
ncbi:hypothetical protein GII33_15295 [Gordonia pseudamarae]|jgi:hypothetical protein|uniref:Uncharacterized protein n=1 Tax=Gordonia pseudamarae TaxID=2831662 RepID=A0ABX6IL24_9ACTN|nr:MULTISPECIES: hypothetical protein [Gordonia]MBD0023173.1 hypothetical protein [Gordonia sp. (in: high G+C Gram-positive bacteria)]QHN27115.1 hypothetical protein GII33_15295 [Gordonia pseudamarae]QHN36005.1 hypothetical protein GII31_15120 [Gordonia pseudamarae]